MSTKKNFTIENYNGTDYDTLYPETNSAQVLLTKTAQDDLGIAGGGGTTPTLDDALNKLNDFDGRYEIGDTLTTSRTNLSNKWLLCNGDTLDSGEYPELGAQFPGVEMHFDKVAEYAQTVQSKTTPYYSIGVRTLDNGDDEALMYLSIPYDSKPLLYYKNLSTTTDWALLGQASVSVMVYVLNNIFVIIPQSANVSSAKAKYCIGTPTSISDFQDLQVPSTLPTDAKWKDAVYHNGKYYFVISGSTNGAVWIYDNITTTPQVVTIFSDTSGHTTMGYALSIADGKVVTNYYTYNTKEESYSNYLVAINADGATSQLSIGRNLAFAANISIWSFHGRYYFILPSIITASSGIVLSIYYADSLSATKWQTLKTIESVLYDVPQAAYHTYIVTDKWIILPDKTYINSNQELKNWDSSSSQSRYWAFSQTDSAIYAMCPQYEIWRSSKSAQFNLPTYSPATGLRAYIKAKD